MKLAIPIWHTRVSPVFDTAERLLILNVEDGREVSRIEHPIAGLSAPWRVKRLSELDVDVLMCGAISRPLANMMAASGIKVVPWVSGNVNDLVAQYLNGGSLDGRFLMPGCGSRRHRFRGGCRRGRARYWADYPEDYV